MDFIFIYVVLLHKLLYVKGNIYCNSNFFYGNPVYLQSCLLCWFDLLYYLVFYRYYVVRGFFFLSRLHCLYYMYFNLIMSFRLYVNFNNCNVLCQLCSSSQMVYLFSILMFCLVFPFFSFSFLCLQINQRSLCVFLRGFWSIQIKDNF